MKIPRDIGGGELARALTVLGYQVVRQSGSHMRLMTAKNGVHHLTIPSHSPLKVGTLLGGILKPVAAHHRLSVEEVSPVTSKCTTRGRIKMYHPEALVF